MSERADRPQPHRHPVGSRGACEHSSHRPETAIQILQFVDDYTSKRVGGVKKLKPPHAGFRPRCGDYRVFFDYIRENAIEITGVSNRKEAYR
jgi:mRNA-degrading endonuclease RelE of RelBE toxin-antitoxin system